MLAAEAARRFGARAAFDTEGFALSFADLDRLSDRVAAGMAHRGVRLGDVVALVLPGGAEYPICFLAAAKIGAVTAGLAPGHPATAALLRRLDPALVIAAPGVPGVPATAVVLPCAERRRDRTYAAARLGGLARPEAPPPPLPPDPLRPVAVVFTRGRSGPPRGAVFGNAQLSAIRAQGAGVRWGTGEARLFGHHPGHVAFTTRIPVFLQTGRTVHVLPRWDPEAALRVLAGGGVGVLQGTPAQLSGMLVALGGGRAPSVRLVLSGGAPAAPELIGEVRARFGARVCNRYVCTEAGLGIGTRPDDPPEDAEVSVGRPGAGVDLSIRDPAGAPVRRGEMGEVLLRSKAVMSGYFRDPAASLGAFARDGFVRTGDLGALDGSGRLRLVAARTGDAESQA
ncbi:acyl-CoA synthetase (AMP-forming)/AMP-acid ligase II [Thermocatellispora tengchongensis]|uniref:Acyl-CoA synthetase (AMP-forming)/AMP-acid ligase II n=1 Tax=Thermocatellispora tengchongensis TaxID=1073253 RepID=A0A840P5T5_9ACTN|nr:class I adenylate-forming enzyme family protein [Thermocatellispora tengchongensis]MBB5133221.1 acyl-CoA synthetase (AMP-forming)/AMP-acid ligase II [Thermocatellispora tengchongensis]